MYRTIDTALWTDPAVRKLDAAGKLLFVYLITNPHAHVGGIYYLSPTWAIHDTGLAASKLDTLSDTLSGLGLARFDQKTDVVWVCKMFKYQGGGEKLERSVGRHLVSLHNSFLIKEFLELYPRVRRYIPDTLSDTLSHTPSEVGSKEQEQEQEQDNTPLAPHGGEATIPAELDTPAFREAWSQWEQHRREKRQPLKPTTVAAQMRKLAGWGVVRAVAALEFSITQGYLGIYEEKTNANGQDTRPAMGRPGRLVTDPGKYANLGTTIRAQDSPAGSQASPAASAEPSANGARGAGGTAPNHPPAGGR